MADEDKSSNPTADAVNAPFTLVDTPAALDRAVAQILAEAPDAIGIDTEFIPESRYVPQLCLVQLATPASVFLIDPLELPDISAMAPLFGPDGPTIVVHAGVQDVGLLELATGVRAQRVFDTQVAAALVTRYEQASFADLCRLFLAQPIDKRSTVTRWNRRPLDPHQLAYAAADVKYLLPLYDALSDQLSRKQRDEWAAEEFERVYAERTLRWADETSAYRKMPKTTTLEPKQVAVLRELFEWRETRAREENANPQNIIPDHKIVRIAAALPRTVDDLKGLRQMPNGIVKNDAEAILACVQTGLAKPIDRSDLAHAPPHKHLSAEDAVHVDALVLLTKIVAHRAEIAPSVLAKREKLMACVRDGYACALAPDGELRGWRSQILGPILHRWASGDLRLGLDPTTNPPTLTFFDTTGTMPEMVQYAAIPSPSRSGAKRRRRRRRKKSPASSAAEMARSTDRDRTDASAPATTTAAAPSSDGDTIESGADAPATE